MSNKNLTIGLIVVGIIAIIALITPVTKQTAVSTPSFGGITNYDQLYLSSETLPELAIGTSTPVTNGEIVVDNSGTTTLVMMSNTAGRGTCLQMETNTGSQVRAYIVGTAWVISAGTCK